MTSITRRGNLTFGTITSMFLFVLILSGCSSAGNVQVSPTPQPSATAEPTKTPEPILTSTATPNPMAFVFDGQELVTTEKHEVDGGIVYEVGDQVYYADQEKNQVIGINKGEYLNIGGLDYKWIAESQELLRVYEHWNICEVEITEEAVNAQYHALVEDLEIWRSYSINNTHWGLTDKDGNTVWFYLLDGFPERKYKRNFANVNGGVFDKDLCLVNVDGNEFQVAVGYIPTRDTESGWKQIATPVSVLTKDGLFVPLFASQGARVPSYELLDLGSQEAMRKSWRSWDDKEFVEVYPSGLVAFGEEKDGVVDLDEEFYARYIPFFDWYFETDDPNLIAQMQDMHLRLFNHGVTTEELKEAVGVMVSVMQGGIDGKTTSKEASLFDFISDNSPIGVWFKMDFNTVRKQ